MKNKEGFTLIELLAIIVILAIIAVITVPIVLNVIDDSKKSAAIDSAYGYKNAVDKLYVSKSMNDSDFDIKDGDYTVADLKTLGVSISGQEPGSNSWVTIIENNVATGCLQYDEYKVDIENGMVESAEKGECDSSVTSFANDSWSKIKTNLKANRNAYPIGSEKIVKMNLTGTEQYYKLRLVNTEPCSSSIATSKTSCGVVIEFVTLIGKHNMNSTDTNAGGWYASEMRSYLNSETNNIYSKLPSNLKSVIISTSPVVSSSGKDGVSDNAEDYLYLLSGREIGFSLTYDNKKDATDTNILSYYNSNNNDNARKKYSETTSEGVDSSPSTYWLRSADFSHNYGFYIILENGNNDNDTRSSGRSNYGVAPAFRILD